MIKKIFGAIILLSFVAIGLYFLLSKNGSDRLNVDLSTVKNEVHIKHFDEAFFNSDTLVFITEFKKLKANFAPFFYSNADVNFWLQQRWDRGQNQLYADWKKVVPTYKALDDNLENAFKHLYYYYPQIPEITLYSYISNLDFEFPIILADTLLFVATDLYLGKNHPAYQNESSYLNYNRQPEFIVGDVMEKFAITFSVKDLDDNTLLNEMIYWGKVNYFNKAMTPNAHDTTLAQMSRKQLEFCLANEVNIWTYFIDNQLLFSTNDEVKRKFIAPAPFSKFGMPFDNESPGMIGRWLGYQIVHSYMQNNPDISLPELMANKDAKRIFKNSKYKP